MLGLNSDIYFIIILFVITPDEHLLSCASNCIKFFTHRTIFVLNSGEDTLLEIALFIDHALSRLCIFHNVVLLDKTVSRNDRDDCVISIKDKVVDVRRWTGHLAGFVQGVGVKYTDVFEVDAG
jgi:hypothetical protein